MKKILLLGSGELGKEFAIAAARLGHYVVAADRYARAPAMLVSAESRVLDMLDALALDQVVDEVRPDLIVPEVEAIRTERLAEYERGGTLVTPGAHAANTTMNRRAIRDLAAAKLGLRTAPYRYASNLGEMRAAVEVVGVPCVVKPLMSSSGKGQSTVRTPEEIEAAWLYAAEGRRGDLSDVIMEGFVEFESEITLLTVTLQSGETVFCPPIGHRQERGDYQESWMPAPIEPDHLAEAQRMAAAVTQALGGSGLWGVEFFLARDGVVFSELSPRPHDTGMVTLSGCQGLNEFELHARAVLGLPVPTPELRFSAASAVILADFDGPYRVQGLADALADAEVDVRMFGKPVARPYRRMGVAVAKGRDTYEARERARNAAAKVRIVPAPP